MEETNKQKEECRENIRSNIEGEKSEAKEKPASEEAAKKEVAERRTVEAIHHHRNCVDGEHKVLAANGLKGTKKYGFALKYGNPDTLLLFTRQIATGAINASFSIGPSGLLHPAPNNDVKETAVIIGAERKDTPIIVCAEPITGAVIHEATGYQVFCSLTDRNLFTVAIDVKGVNLGIKVIVAGDRDGKSIKLINEAAVACLGTCYFPTEWDTIKEVFANEGAEELKRKIDFEQITAVDENLSPVQEDTGALPDDDITDAVITEDKTTPKTIERIGNEANALWPTANEILSMSNEDIKYSRDIADISIKLTTTKSGIPILPKQQEVADRLQQIIGRDMVHHQREIFRYTGKVWEMLDSDDHNKIIEIIKRICSAEADIHYVKNIKEMWTLSLQTLPKGENMFAPPQNKANFLNGTLAMTRSIEKYSIEFREHRKDDCLINLLPFEYHPLDSEQGKIQNDLWLNQLEYIFSGDADKDDKIRGIRQMFGACLMPAFPQIFFCYGVPFTGKSTAAKLASHLIAPANMSDTDPSRLSGFGLESIVGKLVNICTEIANGDKIPDHIIKKLIDNAPMNIERKGKVSISARVPVVHIYCGNDIPAPQDATSGAHNRRWTFIGFNRLMDEPKRVEGYEAFIFNHCRQGVVNFAVQGLMDLVDNGGRFTQSASGTKRKKNWQLEGDYVEMFLESIRDGEVVNAEGKLNFAEGRHARIERKKLFDVFTSWMKNDSGARYPIGKMAFYKAMENKKHFQLKSDGLVFYLGISYAPNRPYAMPSATTPKEPQEPPKQENEQYWL